MARPQNVLVIGNGAREHALILELSQDPAKPRLYAVDGNAGMQKYAQNLRLEIKGMEGILAASAKEKIGFIISGPEVPLVQELLVRRARALGILALGPNQPAAIITEGSKIAAKGFMHLHGIPAARPWAAAETPQYAKNYAAELLRDGPVVVKADGLCGGRGAFICETQSEAANAIDDLIVRKVHGPAGERIVIERKLQGEELSFFILTNGEGEYVFLGACQDFKRRYEKDKGPNTGGMGAVTAPKWFLTPDLHKEIVERIVEPTLRGLRAEGIEYRGFLYFGLMIVSGDPFVLEYNCRLGDPETQVIVCRWRTPILPYLKAAALGKKFPTKKFELAQDEEVACVVMVSDDYPQRRDGGQTIEGIEEAERQEGIVVFHAGTTLEENRVITTGGRILSVVATGDRLREALHRAYGAVDTIHFEGASWRPDIGKKWI